MTNPEILGEMYQNLKPPKLPSFWPTMLGVLILSAIMLFRVKGCSAQDYLLFSNDQIADAIYKAEGGVKAKVPYGILSVKVANEAEARRVCINTIRNNRVRFAKQNKYVDFIEFIASRYAPINATNDPKGLNRHWIKNVKLYLSKVVMTKLTMDVTK